jgi:periplasmic protein CpxP/Spy
MSTDAIHIRRRPRWGHLLIGAAVLIGLVGAGAAWASHRAGAVGHRFGAAAMRLHAEFVVDRALRRAEASDEQRQQIEAILERVFDAHKSLRAEREAMREEAAAVLTADSIDRARLEALRARHLQLIEKGSRQVTQAIGDAAEVLTPEQRRKLVGWLHGLSD